jgi:peptidoglycan hydrolase-like protein with peptidoglycan-binding domain
MPSELTLPFKQAADYNCGRAAPIRLIVLHSMEAAETGATAEMCQNFFATPSGGTVGSTHVCVDNDSAVRSVHDWDTCWGAPCVNSDGLHIEQAGYAAQGSAGWNDDFSRWMIAMQTARVAGYWSWQYNIPLVHLTGSALRDRTRRGFCLHMDATAAWGIEGGHTDPGAGYPIDLFVARAQGWRAQFAGVPVAVKRNPYPTPARLLWLCAPMVSGNDVRFVQWALGIPVDGLFGPQTDAAVRAFQRRQGFVVDGIVGPITASGLTLITR